MDPGILGVEREVLAQRVDLRVDRRKVNARGTWDLSLTIAVCQRSL
jgi:hypothetical protein